MPKSRFRRGYPPQYHATSQFLLLNTNIENKTKPWFIAQLSLFLRPFLRHRTAFTHHYTIQAWIMPSALILSNISIIKQYTMVYYLHISVEAEVTARRYATIDSRRAQLGRCWYVLGWRPRLNHSSLRAVRHFAARQEHNASRATVPSITHRFPRSRFTTASGQRDRSGLSRGGGRGAGDASERAPNTKAAPVGVRAGISTRADENLFLSCCTQTYLQCLIRCLLMQRHPEPLAGIQSERSRCWGKVVVCVTQLTCAWKCQCFYTGWGYTH